MADLGPRAQAKTSESGNQAARCHFFHQHMLANFVETVGVAAVWPVRRAAARDKGGIPQTLRFRDIARIAANARVIFRPGHVSLPL